MRSYNDKAQEHFDCHAKYRKLLANKIAFSSCKKQIIMRLIKYNNVQVTYMLYSTRCYSSLNLMDKTEDLVRYWLKYEFIDSLDKQYNCLYNPAALKSLSLI